MIVNSEILAQTVEDLREPLSGSIVNIDKYIEQLEDRIKDATFYREHIQELLAVLTD